MSGQTNLKLEGAPRGLSIAVRRASLVALRTALPQATNLAVVVSNDVQNDVSPFITIAPLERRNSRLAAPFAVDLGRPDGLRDLHTIRCDWLTRVSKDEIHSVERQQLRGDLIERIEEALRVVLDLKEE